MKAAIAAVLLAVELTVGAAVLTHRPPVAVAPPAPVPVGTGIVPLPFIGSANRPLAL